MKLNQAKILIIEDNADYRKNIEEVLTLEGYLPVCAENGEKGLNYLKSDAFDLVISDYHVPGMPGDQVLKYVKEISPYTATMLMTGFGSIDHAVKLLQEGIDDYLTKKPDLSEFISRVNHLLDQQELRRQVDVLKTQLRHYSTGANIIGKSSAIQNVLQQVAMIATADVSVIIEGESGVGKELIARSIHTSGHRASGPFIPINCGALPENLLESELFGHVKGAFTGANSHRTGVIEAASGGTLFLDEVTEMSQTTQVKLLRTLQENEIRRVGSSTPIQVNVRFIAATNRNIQEEVAAGRFREDLYYRLNVIKISVPSLRERKSDIPLLAQHFLNKYTTKFKKPVTDFSAAAMQKLVHAAWKGNIRELENVIQKAILMTKTSTIIPKDLEVENEDGRKENLFDTITDELPPLKQAKEEFEHRYFDQLLKICEGNAGLAAEKSGLHRKNLWQKLKKFDLNLEDYKI